MSNETEKQAQAAREALEQGKAGVMGCVALYPALSVQQIIQISQQVKQAGSGNK